MNEISTKSPKFDANNPHEENMQPKDNKIKFLVYYFDLTADQELEFTIHLNPDARVQDIYKNINHDLEAMGKVQLKEDSWELINHEC